jgi:hypothetical protein
MSLSFEDRARNCVIPQNKNAVILSDAKDLN